MWRYYSADYLKNNRATGISVMAASFIAALFLSFLCSLFYNFWLDGIEGTKLEDGDWHGRIAGDIGEDGMGIIRCFANVEQAVVNEELSTGQQTVVDIRFYNKRTVYQDMNALMNILELDEEAADYNYQLLSLYFIRIPGDTMPRLLMPAYLAVVALVCLSLILVIHNSFAVSMNSRIHQFGILSSIGASPGQIRTCLLQEALILSLAPILSGVLLGIALSFGTVRVMTDTASNLVGGREMGFSCHPAVLALILLLAVFTVLISAWIPAGRLSRLTPLEAIRGTGELQLKRKRHSRILSMLFGMEGELAGNALKAQKKAMRTTSLSLTLAFLGFMLTQCFFTLSGISTNHTYFEKYQDAWDVMVTVKDTRIEEFDPAVMEELRQMPGTDSSVVYQKAEAVCLLPGDAQSQELKALGGLEAFAGNTVSAGDGVLLTEAPVVILDDGGFGEFCEQIGVEPRYDGTILLNKFWDSRHSNFRYRTYIPFVREGLSTVSLQSTVNAGKSDFNLKAEGFGLGENAGMAEDVDPGAGAETAEEAAVPFGAVVEIPVIACAQEPPVLREEYGKTDYPLVQFIPLSLWKEISGQTGGAERDVSIRVLARERARLDAMNLLEDEITQLVGSNYEIESENRLQEKITNDEMIRGYELLLGAFCVLLAVIGTANVFSNTLGFLRQRKREFARYMSVGLTPEGMRKMFCIEALAVVGRPVLAALALTVVFTCCMISVSYLDPVEFIAVAPALPILAFVLAVFGFVALAYYIGGKKILEAGLADALRDDTML